MPSWVQLASTLASVTLIALSGCAGNGSSTPLTRPPTSRAAGLLSVQQACVELASPASRNAFRRFDIAEGQVVAVLTVPRLGIDVVVAQGATPSGLRVGAGHYPSTPLPGYAGNAAIAVQQLPSGAPDAVLRGLRPSDQVLVSTPLGTYTYQLVRPFAGHANPWLVSAQDFSVIDVPGLSKGTFWLTLTMPVTGRPAQRLVVRSSLTRGGPAGPCHE